MELPTAEQIMELRVKASMADELEAQLQELKEAFSVPLDFEKEVTQSAETETAPIE